VEHNHPPKKLTLSGQTDKKLQHAHQEHDSYPHENHRHDFRSYERKRLLITIILTGTMMIVEILGGIFTGSLALISDAGHMLTHAFALLASFLAILYACRPATKDKSFGFYRAEILAALLNGITLLVITGFILWEAYKRILTPRPIAAKEMIIIGVVGLLVNIATALLLWKASKESLNVRSAFIHMLGDTGSSVGVVIGAFIIYFTGFYIIDPIFSIIIAILILIWSISLIRDSVRILMESTPKNINVGELKAGVIVQNAKVKDIHDLHVWEITSNMYCMTAHMVIEDMNVSQTQQLLDEISQYLLEKYNIQHPIIQFETGGGFDHGHGCNLDNH
jgi:cobalt-zinc-cadmium efflux system protein